MCEYINHTHHGAYHCLTQLPSDAIEVRRIIGWFRLQPERYLWYNPKTHDIYKANTQSGRIQSFPYLVITGKQCLLHPNKYLKTDVLVKYLEMTYG